MNLTVDLQQEGRHVTAMLEGELTIRGARTFYDRMAGVVADADIDEIKIDFRGVDELDSGGIAVLTLLQEELHAQQKRVELVHLTESQRAALEMVPAGLDEAEDADELGFFESIGDSLVGSWVEFGHLVELVYDSLRMSFLVVIRKKKLPPGSVIEQSVLIGVNALFIIALLSFLLGLIMAFQSAYQLRQFGANIYVANLVGISMVREFGPMMTAIMLAGRSGSSIAAELGTMTVQEEVDALKTMGIDPLRFLVLPRLVALTLMQPALTLMADFVGILGGFIIGTLLLDLSANAYFEQTVDAVTMGDFWNGLLKSVIFAWIIGITGCFTGLRIKGGASSVGKATTQSVVTSIFLIIVADSIFATVVTLLEEAA